MVLYAHEGRTPSPEFRGREIRAATKEGTRAMAQAAVRQHVNSLERWQAALARAIAAGLEVFVIDGARERVVTSASRLDTVYRTDGRSCTCAAALAGDPVCQHRAAARACLGWLTLPDDAPAVAETASGASCFWCSGSGRQAGVDGFERCDRCGGTGQRPTRAPAALPSRIAA